MMKIKTTNNKERVDKIQFFLNDAVNDYIAARTLFLSQLPSQASILSSTAIEKLFKALLAFNGNNCQGHLKKAHWNAIRNFDNKSYSLLNINFLKLNQKVYKMRYSEVLPVGFNVVIACREFLAELDYTFITLFKNISIGNHNTSFEGTSLYSMINSKDGRLLLDNHIFQGISKEHFIYSKCQFVYEVRIMKERKPIKTEYWSEKKPKHDSFLREGLIINNESNINANAIAPLNLELAFYPMQS